MKGLSAFIREKIALHFARKAAKSIGDARFMFRHCPMGTFGHEKGRVRAAVASVYAGLAAAFGVDDDAIL